MKTITSILGNATDPEWRAKLKCTDLEYINISGEFSKHSHIEVQGDNSSIFVLSFEEPTKLSDGDIVDYDPVREYAAVIKIID